MKLSMSCRVTSAGGTVADNFGEFAQVILVALGCVGGGVVAAQALAREHQALLVTLDRMGSDMQRWLKAQESS